MVIFDRGEELLHALLDIPTKPSYNELRLADPP